MPSQTRDLEAAICGVLNSDGPLTLEALIGRFGDITDPRWVGVALVHLRRDNVIRWTTCEPTHNHNGDCTAELNP